MRIIHVTPSYFDEASIIGGGERYVDELAKFQARLPGTEVFIFSFGPKNLRFQRQGVRYRVFRVRQWKHFTLSNPFALRHFFALRKASIIHVHQLCTFVSDLAALASRFWRIPLFGTDHGGGGAWVLNTRLPVYRCYWRVIAQSGQAAEPLRSHFANRIQIIPGGVDLERFVPAEDASGRQKQILFVGRLLPHKGVDLLIRSFTKLESPGWKLRIVGRPQNASFFSKLKQLAEGFAVEFETNLSDDAVIDAYQQAAVTVLSSIGGATGSPAPELMGFTVLESLACGTPVVCSDSGPMREFIEEGSTGWVHRAGDEDSLIDALTTAVRESETHHNDLGRRCREHVARFSWSSVASEHLATYSRMIRSKED